MSLFLPFARLLLSTFLPSAVLILFLKPCSTFLWRFFGWYVLSILTPPSNRASPGSPGKTADWFKQYRARTVRTRIWLWNYTITPTIIHVSHRVCQELFEKKLRNSKNLRFVPRLKTRGSPLCRLFPRRPAERGGFRKKSRSGAQNHRIATWFLTVFML